MSLDTSKARTFRHLTAGSTIILKDGSVLQFGGKKGEHGFITTDLPEAIEMLSWLAKNPIAPVEEVIDVVAAEVVSPPKPPDPALDAAKKDSETNTGAESNPQIAALRANLGNLIASGGQSPAATPAA